MKKPPTIKCSHCNGKGWVPDIGKMGEELRIRRKTLQIGLREMAQRLGLSSGYLHDLEHGRRSWTPEVLQKYRAQLCL